MLSLEKQKLFIFILLFILKIELKSAKDDQQLFGDIFQGNSRSLSLSIRRNHRFEHKCQREVPAIFFQTVKNEPIRGNGSTIFFNRIEVCCEGYVRSPFDWEKCVPNCSKVSANNCRNGSCRAPQKCECFDEFVSNDHGECVQTCPISCQNGRCYLNGTCECLPGYTLDPQTRKFCRPSCEQTNCGKNQECVRPGRCECKQGYRMTSDLGCQPICTPDCGFGQCVGPNECQCFSGYMKRPQKNVCEAECYIHCENGFCESRYKCQCRDGYKYDTNTTSCLPDCGDNCQNGVCAAPGVCRCFEGYELAGNTCVPICIGGCGYYGNCIEPGVCGCRATGQHCILGICDANGRCLCNSKLTHFIDRCLEAHTIENLVSTYHHRDHYNYHLRLEFQNLIGRSFHILT